jgi:hypothetical protein
LVSVGQGWLENSCPQSPVGRTSCACILLSCCHGRESESLRGSVTSVSNTQPALSPLSTSVLFPGPTAGTERPSLYWIQPKRQLPLFLTWLLLFSDPSYTHWHRKGWLCRTSFLADLRPALMHAIRCVSHYVIAGFLSYSATLTMEVILLSKRRCISTKPHRGTT